MNGIVAFVTPSFKFSSVVLDHSHYVSSVKYSTGKLDITFETSDAYSQASESWPTEKGLILITYTPGCGGYSDGERCYFQVTGWTFDVNSMTIYAAGSALDSMILFTKLTSNGEGSSQALYQMEGATPATLGQFQGNPSGKRTSLPPYLHPIQSLRAAFRAPS